MRPSRHRFATHLKMRWISYLYQHYTVMLRSDPARPGRVSKHAHHSMQSVLPKHFARSTPPRITPSGPASPSPRTRGEGRGEGRSPPLVVVGKLRFFVFCNNSGRFFWSVRRGTGMGLSTRNLTDWFRFVQLMLLDAILVPQNLRGRQQWHEVFSSLSRVTNQCLILRIAKPIGRSFKAVFARTIA